MNYNLLRRLYGYVRQLIWKVFRLSCPHDNISWPIYGIVQCHDCHERLQYDWSSMEIIN